MRLAQQRPVGQLLQAAWEACNAPKEVYQCIRTRIARWEGWGGRVYRKYKLRTRGVKTSARGSQGQFRAAMAFAPASIRPTHHKYLVCICRNLGLKIQKILCVLTGVTCLGAGAGSVLMFDTWVNA